MSFGVIDPIVQKAGAPVEPALQQHGAAGVARALEAGLQLRLNRSYCSDVS